MVKFNDEIESIEEIGELDVMDIQVSDDHLFYANDILVKNSLGVPATADFMAIYGSNEEQAVYESELFYKIVKNRLGGRVGEIDKFYFDQRNLKMYDSSQQDIWMEDSKVSGDSRNMAQIQQQPAQTSRGRRTRSRDNR